MLYRCNKAILQLSLEGYFRLCFEFDRHLELISPTACAKASCVLLVEQQLSCLLFLILIKPPFIRMRFVVDLPWQAWKFGTISIWLSFLFLGNIICTFDTSWRGSYLLYTSIVKLCHLLFSAMAFSFQSRPFILLSESGQNIFFLQLLGSSLITTSQFFPLVGS